MASGRCDHHRMFHDRLCPSFGGGNSSVQPRCPLPTVGRLRSCRPGDPCGASLRTCRIEESGEPPSPTNVRAGPFHYGWTLPRTLTFSVLRQGHRPCGTSHRSGSWLAQRPAYRASCELVTVLSRSSRTEGDPRTGTSPHPVGARSLVEHDDVWGFPLLPLYGASTRCPLLGGTLTGVRFAWRGGTHTVMPRVAGDLSEHRSV
jgi:hypothetical protein